MSAPLCPLCQSPLTCWPVRAIVAGAPVAGSFAGVQVICPTLICSWMAPVLESNHLIEAGLRLAKEARA